jgi:hypothetical protein
MQTNIVAVSILTALSVGCANRAAALPRPASTAEAKHDVRPLNLTYSVSSLGEGPTTLMSGTSELGPRGLKVESIDAERAAKTELELSTHRLDDGSMVVDATYTEREHANEIKWSPSLRVAPKTQARAVLTGQGWTRELRVTTD